MRRLRMLGSLMEREMLPHLTAPHPNYTAAERERTLAHYTAMAAGIEPPQPQRCGDCGSARGVSHWHDPKWCDGIECGGILCENCAEARATRE